MDGTHPFEILLNDPKSLVGVSFITEPEPLMPAINLLPEEQKELDRISNPTYRKQWINSRWLAVQCRNLIKADIPEISKSTIGKPYIKDSDLHISLSHNPNISSVMISKVGCGVDVENFRPKIKNIKTKFLTSKELELKDQSTELLTLIWSAKESLYKMLGVPGLVFKEQLNCLISSISENGSFTAEYLNSGKIEKELTVDYRVFENDLITYTRLS